MDSNKDYYAILGVLPTAEDIVIRAAYKALAQRYHPDRTGHSSEANAAMAEINEAYSVLADPEKRDKYDEAWSPMREDADPSVSLKDEKLPREVLEVIESISSGKRVRIGRRVILDQHGIHRVAGLLYDTGNLFGTSSTLPWSEYGCTKWEKEDNKVYIKRGRYRLLPGVFGAFSSLDYVEQYSHLLPFILRECAKRFG